MNYSKSVLQVFMSELSEMPRCRFVLDVWVWMMLNAGRLSSFWTTLSSNLPHLKTCLRTRKPAQKVCTSHSLALSVEFLFFFLSNQQKRFGLSFSRSSRGLCIVSHPPQLHPQSSVHFRDAEAVFSLLWWVWGIAASGKRSFWCRDKGKLHSFFTCEPEVWMTLK